MAISASTITLEISGASGTVHAAQVLLPMAVITTFKHEAVGDLGWKLKL